MRELLELLNQGTSPYHAVRICIERLEEAGYQELRMNTTWNLAMGSCYYVSPYPSMLVAFVTPDKLQNNTQDKSRLRLAMAHTDYPCFKLKSHPEYTTKQFLQVNVEPYGGMIKSSWFDRPLQLAGKVMLRSDDVYEPKMVLFESEKPLFVIPSLAPHLDRDANGKHDYDMQQELQPIAGLLQEQCNKDDFLMEYLASKLGVDKKDILSFDLFLTNQDQAELVGMQEEFLSAPRIDNLASVSALVEAMCQAKTGEESDIRMIALYDNEEIGSRSKQGADSMLLTQLLYKMGQSMKMNTVAVNDMIGRGFLMSVDGAQALHPNYAAKSDPTNEVYMGSGIVLKTSASQRYVTDSAASAVVLQLCEQTGVKCQQQVNRSGMPGGQTLGPIASSYLPMLGVDLGIPMLAMHSARELAAGADYEELVKLLVGFYRIDTGEKTCPR